MFSPFEKRTQSEVGQGQKQEKTKQLSDPGAEGVRQRHRPIRLLTGWDATPVAVAGLDIASWGGTRS